MDDAYVPVPGLLVEELEVLAMMGKPCVLRFMQEGHVAEARGTVDNISYRDDTPFLELQGGLVIRLDRITELNGMHFGTIA